MKICQAVELAFHGNIFIKSYVWYTEQYAIPSIGSIAEFFPINFESTFLDVQRDYVIRESR